MKKLQMRLLGSSTFASLFVASLSMLLMSASGCESGKAKHGMTSGEPARVEIETKFGSMIVQLSDSTPQHRDNFLKLVDEQFYDSLIFHRVIREFMVQGGDPQSKGADANARLEMEVGYTVEAEIRPDLLHFKGALSAARQGDNVNPERRSSGSQFYLVQGRPFSDNEMSGIEGRIANFSMEYGNGLANVENGQFVYSDEAREMYKTVGGTPFLDMQYTVFGYVVEGLDIVDSIAAVPTDRRRGDRPLEDVVMSMERLNWPEPRQAMKERIEQMLAEVAGVELASPEAVENFRVAYLGRKGKVKDLMAAFKEVPGDQKREIGPMLNTLKQAIEQRVSEAQQATVVRPRPRAWMPHVPRAVCPWARITPFRSCVGKSSTSFRVWALPWQRAPKLKTTGMCSAD